jgi:hypothetical protein
MMKLLDKLSKGLSRYLAINRLINGRTSLRVVAKTFIWALVSSAVIASVPVLLVINMFIYTKLTLFLAILLLILALCWVYVYFLIYYKLLVIYVPSLEPVNLTYARRFEAVVTAAVIFAIGITVIVALF